MLLWRGFPLRREPAPDCGRYFPKCLRLDASGLRDHERLVTNTIVRKGRIQRHASEPVGLVDVFLAKILQEDALADQLQLGFLPQ